MKKWGALAVAVLGAAVMLVSSAGAAEQSLAGKLSTRTGANLYLVQHGLNPSGFVIQRGTHNYAGPNCPGKGWNCTASKRVLQIADRAGQANQADCSGAGIVTDNPGDCEIVQTNTDGANDATCDQSATGETAQQRCVVFQTNQGGGSNTVHVSQEITTSNGEGTDQNVHQYIGINQQNDVGNNAVVNAATAVIDDATVSYTQYVDESVSGGTNLQQDSLQEISLTQNTDSGQNNADELNQILIETMQSNAGDGQPIEQRQNTTATSPNTNAGVNQTTSSGSNSATLSQSHDLSELATGDSTGIVQAQGSSQGGINSVVDQQDNGDNGISEYSGSQNESQTENVTGGTIKGQTQIGPMWGDPQSSNPEDSFALNQTSTQHIFPNSGTQSPGQHDAMFLNCDTQGSCSGGQNMTQNSQENSDGCDGSPCNIQMIDRVFAPCAGDCPHPPPPPEPQKPSGPSTCALIATIDNPPDPKQIKIEVQDSAGVNDIHVDSIVNATSSTDPASYQGSTDPITVTATKTDQTKGSSIRLTITNGNGDTTTCDPFVPASRKHAAAKSTHVKTHVVKANGLTLKLGASRLVYGQPKQLTLTGTVPTGRAGEKVTLLTSTCGFKGAAKLATLTTGRGGVFRYSFAPALGASYVVQWNGKTSARQGIHVRPQIALVKVGSGRYRVDVSTTNGVFLTGAKAAVQALAGGHWKTIATGKLAPNSPVDVMTAVSSTTIKATGKKLRAFVPATTCYSSAASR